MYLSQTHGSESALCAGACRGIETGAEGVAPKQPKGGKNGFGESTRDTKVNSGKDVK